MIDIQKIAREAGYGKLQVTKHQTKWSIKDDELDKANRFAVLIREALVQELVAGSGEPYFENIDIGFRTYTADQLAGAVLRERERCAKVVEEFPHDQLGCLDEVAAAIRGQR